MFDPLTGSWYSPFGRVARGMANRAFHSREKLRCAILFGG
jgi:hypothetical protein